MKKEDVTGHRRRPVERWWNVLHNERDHLGSRATLQEE